MISTDIMQQPAAAGPVTGVTSCEQATENGGRYILQKSYILALKEHETQPQNSMAYLFTKIGPRWPTFKSHL